MNFLNSVKSGLSKTGFALKQKAPSILIGTGLVGFGAFGVLVGVATSKLSPVVEQTKKDLEAIEVAKATHSAEEYSEEDAKKDRMVVYRDAALEIAKLYSIPVLVFVLSSASTLIGFGKLKEQAASIAAAYATLDATFRGYRKRVADKYGAEEERNLRYGLVTIPAEEGEEDLTVIAGDEGVTTCPGYVNPNQFSDYARIFDESNINWKKDSSLNLSYLKLVNNVMNDKLIAEGHLFLNDVYKALGFEPTQAGQTVGWIYAPEDPDHVGDNFVDFGIFDVFRPKANDFVNGYERSIILDFNVDGVIIDKAFK